jgi:hypothetical protein
MNENSIGVMSRRFLIAFTRCRHRAEYCRPRWLLLITSKGSAATVPGVYAKLLDCREFAMASGLSSYGTRSGVDFC